MSDKSKRNTTRDHSGPISQTYRPLPHPNPYISEKPFPRPFPRGAIHPPFRNTMLRKIYQHCTARQNWAEESCVDLLKTPEPLTVPAEFLKNVVPYPPSTHASPKSPFRWLSEKVQHTPTNGTPYSKKSADNAKAPVSGWFNPPPPMKTPIYTYIHTYIYIYI